jgi:hypothetical protein
VHDPSNDPNRPIFHDNTKKAQSREESFLAHAFLPFLPLRRRSPVVALAAHPCLAAAAVATSPHSTVWFPRRRRIPAPPIAEFSRTLAARLAAPRTTGPDLARCRLDLAVDSPAVVDAALPRHQPIRWPSPPIPGRIQVQGRRRARAPALRRTAARCITMGDRRQGGCGRARACGNPTPRV